MTGGIIQLCAHGVQDLFLTHDPQITFFKIVYRRHTNFSIDQIPQDFINTPDFGKRATCILSRQGDLIGQIYLVITLPSIKQFYLDAENIDNFTKFAWVRKLGYAMINYIEIEISGQIIDRHYGEWLNIWNELFISPDKVDGLNKMIGNIPELTDFTNGKEAYTLYVPLQFWFCKNTGLALPLISLQYSEVKINVELNDVDQCFLITPTNYIEIYNDIVNFQPFEYIEQNVNGVIASGIYTGFDFNTKRLYYKKISRNNFQSIQSTATSLNDIINTIFNDANLKYFITGVTTKKYIEPRFNAVPHPYTPNLTQNISITKCFLLVDYIYLDEDERSRFVQTKHDYLIEQVGYVNEQFIEGTNRLMSLDLIQPCKLLVWVAQQDYLTDLNNNDFFNYTDSYIYINEKPAGKSFVKAETIKLAGENLLSKRSYHYFNYVEAYEHCLHSPNEGINIYSFALFPGKYQPSGSCNMSQIDDIQADLSLTNIITLKNVAKFRAYSLSYNVLRIVNGLSGIVFTK